MDRFISLNLKNEDEKQENANLSQSQPQVREPDISSKKLNEIANRAAHRAAGHGSGGLFSK